MFTKKEQSYQSNPEKSYTEKKTKHEPFGCAMLTKYSFDKTEDKFNYYRGRIVLKNCVKR